MKILTSIVLGCSMILLLAGFSLAADDRSAFDDYYALKENLLQNAGLDMGFKESLMFQQRTGTSLGERNYDLNGQFDFYADWSLFDGHGRFYGLYMNIHQLGGLTTTEFGQHNGNITPINDSDPSYMLRFLMYAHTFLDGRLTIMGGKFEPLLQFGANRFAADDRTTFHAMPLATAGVKDRTFSSLGGGVTFQVVDWLNLGASLNSLDFSSGISGEPFGENGYYSIVNASVTTGLESLGEANIRVSWIHTDGQNQNGTDVPSSDGFILSADQELGANWGAFARVDNTDDQVAASPLVESYAGGVAYRGPFNRARDHAALGLFRVKSETRDIDEWENGFEVFYRFGLTPHIDLTANLQGFDPARADGFFTVAGVRLMLRF